MQKRERMRGLQKISAIVIFFTCNCNRGSCPSLMVVAFVAPRIISTAKVVHQTKDDNGEDWRDFRARLVQKEGGQSSSDAGEEARSANEWAYESNLIERGSVILSRPKPAFGGGLLRHPFWHKAVMLILEHDDNKETLGIFLNRPTDLVKYCNENNDSGWRVWYGGPVHSGLTFADEDTAEILCLHTMTSTETRMLSTEVVKNIQYTTFANATSLVKRGTATPDDFWVFAGYCGWTAGQLKRELIDDGFWMAVAADSGTLLHELKEQAKDAQPQMAGMNIWNDFVQLIGKNDVPESTVASDSFDDLLLKEWARDKLIHHKAAESMENELSFSGGQEVEIRPGTMLRAKVHPRSPFLLSDQDMHKCIFLVVSENIYGTVGVILNLPTTKTVDLNVANAGAADEGSSSAPILLRYGGNTVVFGEGERPLLWLHCNDKLRQTGVGIPLDDFDAADGVWECTSRDVASAIGSGMASPSDFMVVSGGFIWVKDNDGRTGGMRGQVWSGRFEIIPVERMQKVWDTLLAQEVMTRENVDQNLGTSFLAWEVASAEEEAPPKESLSVFGSDVNLAQLEDEAMRRWVAKYVMNDPGCVT